MTLGLDSDELASCVQCGLCLPHCPTWRVTGEESRSPRGRIALMRDLECGEAEIDASATEALESCVQCRGCEPACPSGVPFGHLMETTRAELSGRGPRWRAWPYRVLGSRRLVRAGVALAAVAQRVGIAPRRAVMPRLPLRRGRLDLRESAPSTRRRVVLVTGCVMDAAQRPVHQATVDVLRALGHRVVLPARHEGCCGALAAHAGHAEVARAQGERLVGMLDGDDAPLVVDSAGCGAHLRLLGERLGTPRAIGVSARVVDVHELVAFHRDELAAMTVDIGRVAVQDPCHLRHVQRAHLAVHEVLSSCATVVPLDDDGLCCGAGGAFSLLRPDDAVAIRARKVAAIERAGASVVASANPGCQLLLGAAGLDVRHPMEIVAGALRVNTER